MGIAEVDSKQFPFHSVLSNDKSFKKKKWVEQVWHQSRGRGIGIGIGGVGVEEAL